MLRFVYTIAVFLTTTAQAQSNLIDAYKETVKSPVTTWVLDSENDAYRGSDRYYTNGIRFTRYHQGAAKLTLNGKHFASFDNDEKFITVPGAPQPTLRNSGPSDCTDEPESAYQMYYQANKLGCFNDGQDIDVHKHYAGWTFANLIYTPTEITATFDEFQPYDRPYAGYTYFGRFVETVRANDSSTHYEVQAGILGKASMSQTVQRVWHKIFGFDRPEWDKQIDTEPALQVNVRYRFAVPSYLKYDLDESANIRLFDIQPYLFAEVGTVFVRATAGIDARIGFNMKGQFSGQKITDSLPKAFDSSILTDESGCMLYILCLPESGYLFGKIEETGVLRNSTIEGGMFTSSEYTQDIRHHVRTTSLGAKINWENWWLSVAFNNRSPEIKGIPFDSKYHRWGEFQIGGNW